MAAAVFLLVSELAGGACSVHGISGGLDCSGKIPEVQSREAEKDCRYWGEVRGCAGVTD